MQASTLYLRTVQAAQKYNIICHEGGSRSSKTYSIFQFFINKALSGEIFSLTICRDKFTWIKETLLQDFEDITNNYNIQVSPAINRNRPDQTYYIRGAKFTFWGLDTPAKVHGKKQDWVWINEAIDIDKKTFDQLEMRTTTGMVLDYNPADDLSWVFALQLRADVIKIHSTMLDNPFLGAFERRKILSYEPTPENLAAGTADNFMWEVYGLGHKARLKGVVYNWDMVDSIPEHAILLGGGLDFGYTNDPTALPEIWKFNNELYFNEIIYDTGLTNPDIDKRLVELEVAKSFEIFGDSSEPKSIEELRRYGWNIKPVTKGADSINFGIDILKGYKCHYTKKSIHIDNEVRRYKWAEDKNGNLLNKPIDAFNHAMDAIRYYAMMKLIKKRMVTISQKIVG